MIFCPVHKNYELRRENYVTGFCLKCLCYYALCCETKYLSICKKLLGHDGVHESEDGMKWCEEENELPFDKFIF